MHPTSSHRWSFFRAGGLDQVQLNDAADLQALASLDRKLWVALACPVKGLGLDERTLALMDTDQDGRVRVPEVLAAIEFLRSRLHLWDGVMEGSPWLEWERLHPDTPQGLTLRQAARQLAMDILAGDEGRAPSLRLGLEHLEAGRVRLQESAVAALAAVDARPDWAEAVRAAVHGFRAVAAGATSGAVSGAAPGPASDADAAHALKIDDATALAGLEAFAAIAPAIDAWWQALDHQAYWGAEGAGPDAGGSHALLVRLPPVSNPAVTEGGDEAAHPVPALDLTRRVHPEWAAALAPWVRLLGPQASAVPRDAWTPLRDRLAQVVAARQAARTQAQAVATEPAAWAELETVIRLQRDLLRLVRNFVSFADFYSGQQPATFLAGRLFLDARECQLCLRVDEVASHAVLASLSKCFLAYCDVVRDGGSRRMNILAVFTQGDSDFLMVGRRGLFIDRQGNDWDATITRIVDAPISIRQAFVAPYKKFIRWIDEQVAKRAGAADSANQAQLEAQWQASATAATAAPGAAGGRAEPARPEPAKGAAAEPRKIDLGTIALIGTAISGVAAMVGLVLERFLGLGVYMPVGILGLIAFISGPSMMIAALKLRQRSLGPILDACGWAVNGRVRLTLPLGVRLTAQATVPLGSRMSLQDPFAEASSPGKWLALGLAAAAAGAFFLWKAGLWPF